MVSNAREDLPDPLKPVITTSRSRGISSVMFLRLCSRAPPTLMNSFPITSGVVRIALNPALRQAHSSECGRFGRKFKLARHFRPEIDSPFVKQGWRAHLYGTHL